MKHGKSVLPILIVSGLILGLLLGGCSSGGDDEPVVVKSPTSETPVTAPSTPVENPVPKTDISTPLASPETPVVKEKSPAPKPQESLPPPLPEKPSDGVGEPVSTLTPKAIIPAFSPTPSSNGDVVRLFYYGPSTFGGDPAAAPGPHNIYSATSIDGINFTEDAGVRFFHDTGQAFGITDSDVVQLDDGSWLMLVSLGTTLLKAIAADSAEVFVGDASFNWNQGGVPGSFNFDGVVRTFVCSDGGINMATYDQSSGDLISQGVALEPPSFGVICDPSVIQVGDRYLMIYKYAASHAVSPQEHEVYLATSSDGLNWSQHAQNRFICKGSVPGAVYFQGVIFIYYCGVPGPGELGVAVSEDGGDTFKILPKISIQGKGDHGIVDPAVVVVSP